MNLTQIVEEEYPELKPSELINFKVRENNEVKTLISLFKEWLDLSHANAIEYRYDKMGYHTIPVKYSPAGGASMRLTLLCDKISSFVCTSELCSEDITSLCFLIGDFEKHPSFTSSGEFFMPLINAHHSKTKNPLYTLVTTHLQSKINVLGKRNANAIINIYGDIGDALGEEMNGGIITLYGNANSRVGSSVNNGTIILNGDAGEDVGSFMQNGRIELNGTYQTISRHIRGGEIYWKGEKISE